ncbi:hypothetical protein [Silvimonas iriomotensis]|nr:hypothetical protein [Silvimonas iriomotensis]
MHTCAGQTRNPGSKQARVIIKSGEQKPRWVDMDAELATLEEKINMLVRIVAALRSENHQLRQEILASGRENQQLVSKLDETKTRVAALIERLPEEEA